MACDFDKGTWLLDALVYLDVCHSPQVPAVLERSRSGDGGRVWVFFDFPVPAARRRPIRPISQHLDRTTRGSAPLLRMRSQRSSLPTRSGRRTLRRDRHLGSGQLDVDADHPPGPSTTIRAIDHLRRRATLRLGRPVLRVRRRPRPALPSGRRHQHPRHARRLDRLVRGRRELRQRIHRVQRR
ncbi:MAG: TOTE conflict system archaeo-eukaryotic primase domain-containing protein [Actinomycetota bacterium]